ncbi:hypothetical protein EVAR_65625_1 [Eumeta japonica]|uniref:Uncharacterized protein n=1 Tax=Eumeta variegata TaxID=151549 RepID=A0A4C1ZA95_EUMVA|nr:hypothetical protein EVAR_65625_1 [Eumeta japonica]
MTLECSDIEPMLKNHMAFAGYPPPPPVYRRRMALGVVEVVSASRFWIGSLVYTRLSRRTSAANALNDVSGGYHVFVLIAVCFIGGGRGPAMTFFGVHDKITHREPRPCGVAVCTRQRPAPASARGARRGVPRGAGGAPGMPPECHIYNARRRRYPERLPSVCRRRGPPPPAPRPSNAGSGGYTLVRPLAPKSYPPRARRRPRPLARTSGPFIRRSVDDHGVSAARRSSAAGRCGAGVHFLAGRLRGARGGGRRNLRHFLRQLHPPISGRRRSALADYYIYNSAIPRASRLRGAPVRFVV